MWMAAKPAKCPNCGAEVYIPAKFWTVKNRHAVLRALIYECPRCGHKFRTIRKVE